jgi:hypothetical protein
MKKHATNSLFRILVCAVLGLLVANTSALAQAETGEDLEKKYAPILGEYEFDGNGTAITLRFYIEENKLWADSGDGRPAVMEPVEGGDTFEFKAEDEINGVFNFTFLKDTEGEYSICRFANEESGMEVEGYKIK